MLDFTYTLLTACTIASEPTGTPTPTCRGVKALKVSPRTAREMHLDVSLRSTSPEAIGCKPPPFFLQENKNAPHRSGTTSKGT